MRDIGPPDPLGPLGHPDIHLPVKPSPVDEPSQFYMITRRGAHDVYKINPDGEIQKLSQTSPQEFIPITDIGESAELTEACRRDVVKRPNPAKPGEYLVVANLINKFSANDQKVIDVFKMIGSTFKGHATSTCGHYCLLTNLALLGETILESDKIVQITFTGLTELTLDKFQSTTDDKNTERTNREKLKEWFKKNERTLIDKCTPGDEACIKELIKELEDVKCDLDSADIKAFIKKATELTGKEDSVLDPEIVNIQQAINTARSVTPENSAEKLQALKDSEKLKTIVNLEGVTTDDIAIIALLTAFLTVLGGPAAIPATIASIILLSKTLRMHNIEITDDDIAKITPPQTTTKHPEGQQVAKETSHHLAAAA